MRELQKRITSAEFVEYWASYRLDGRGPHYDDLRAGVIASMIANVHRDTARRPEPFDMLDFIPWSDRHGDMPTTDAAREDSPVLLGDADAQTKLLISNLFPTAHG